MQSREFEIDNLPNRLTIFRIALIPLVVGLLLFTHQNPLLGWVAGWIFILASITDFFDGYIARKRNIVTIFGSFLDPVADKFLIVSSLIMLTHLGRIHAVIVVILILREFYITSLRLLALHQGVSVPVNQWGKFKTIAQMVSIPMLMAYETWNSIPFSLLGTLFIYLAFFLSLFSAFNYSAGLFRKLRENRKLKKEKTKEKKEQ